MLPFLRMPGSYKLQASVVQQALPKTYSRAVLLNVRDAALAPFQLRRRAKLTLHIPDNELHRVYQTLASHPEDVAGTYAELLEDTSEAEFYSVRTAHPETPVEEAARYIYLNQLASTWKTLPTANYSPRHPAPAAPELVHAWGVEVLAGSKLVTFLPELRAKDLLLIEGPSPLATYPDGVKVLQITPQPSDAPEGWTVLPVDRRRPGRPEPDALLLNY